MGIINLRAGDEKCDAAAEEIYSKLGNAGKDALLDDRDQRGGVKFADMDLIGLPWQIIAGPRGLESGVVELKSRASGAREEMSIDAALNKLTSPAG